MSGEQCPCGSTLEYSACCEPYISGAKPAPTAEALMRSRYSAFVKSAVPYIQSTILPQSRTDFDEKSIADWSKNSKWLGLEIKSTEAGDTQDTTGKVEFIARYSLEGKEQAHHEVGSFTKQDGQWFFVDGTLLKDGPFVRSEPKTGRNDPCVCGSGKKYKKCCAK